MELAISMPDSVFAWDGGEDVDAFGAGGAGEVGLELGDA